MAKGDAMRELVDTTKTQILEAVTKKWRNKTELVKATTGYSQKELFEQAFNALLREGKIEEIWNPRKVYRPKVQK